MKILHVYRTFYPDPPGGLQEAIRQIALSTEEMGCENRIFCLSPKPNPEIEYVDGIPIYRAKSWIAPYSCDIGLLGSFKLFQDLTTWADIVQLHFPWPFADILNLLTRHKKPTLMTYHSDVVNKGLLGRFYMPLLRKTLSSMGAVVTTSPRYAETSPFLKSMVSTEKLKSINYGVHERSYASFFADSESIDIEAKFGLQKEKYFLFLGVLRKYKGLDYLLPASDLSDLPIAIGGSGELKDYYNKKAKNHANINMLGHLTDAEKIALIRNCKGLILPSHLRSEAFGIVLIEASMCSKPLVSCEIGTGTSFANLDQVTGYVVEPEKPEQLALAMNKISRDDVLSKELGLNARKRYETMFSGGAVGKSYVALYNEISKNYNV